MLSGMQDSNGLKAKNTDANADATAFGVGIGVRVAKGRSGNDKMSIPRCPSLPASQRSASRQKGRSLSVLRRQRTCTRTTGNWKLAAPGRARPVCCLLFLTTVLTFAFYLLTFGLTPHMLSLSSNPDGKRARRPSAPDISTAARPSPAKLDDSVAARNSDLRS